MDFISIHPVKFQYSKYEDKFWHKNCFKCTECRDPLAGKSFNLRGTRVYCADCYDGKYSGACYSCKRGFRGSMWL